MPAEDSQRSSCAFEEDVLHPGFEALDAFLVRKLDDVLDVGLVDESDAVWLDHDVDDEPARVALGRALLAIRHR